MLREELIITSEGIKSVTIEIKRTSNAFDTQEYFQTNYLEGVFVIGKNVTKRFNKNTTFRLHAN